MINYYYKLLVFAAFLHTLHHIVIVTHVTHMVPPGLMA